MMAGGDPLRRRLQGVVHFLPRVGGRCHSVAMTLARPRPATRAIRNPARAGRRDLPLSEGRAGFQHVDEETAGTTARNRVARGYWRKT